ncbi:hypothetical protein X801_09636 [Opisthorchis viverrini]|uniref:Uncharacterized protein n=1 Tax=Opisthorchis viverrini TaxID=6198 RepID=A0A1S8WJG0_OPIVI|nr:hypothetical protein X801_09636 [Opisthorchis viverrini]
MTCSATLEQLQHPNYLNSCRTLGAVAARLPSTIQTKWFNLTAKSFSFKRDPTFTEMANFISDKADTAAAPEVYASPVKPSETPTDTVSTVQSSHPDDAYGQRRVKSG